MKPKFKKHLRNPNIPRLKAFKPIFYKIIFSIGIIVCILVFKTLNFRTTTWILDKIKYNTEYEIDFRNSSRLAYKKAQNIIKDPENILTVFNIDSKSGSKSKYPSPINGKISKEYERYKNEGLDIKSDDGKDPKVIIKGTVKDIYPKEKQGYFVIIESEDIQITYGYLSKVYVSTDDLVDVGTSIGSLGTDRNGNKYLKIQLKIDGTYRNPSEYIDFKQ